MVTNSWQVRLMHKMNRTEQNRNKECTLIINDLIGPLFLCFSGAASGKSWNDANRCGNGKSYVDASGERPDIPGHHTQPGWTQQKAFHVQCHRHQAGCQRHPPMLRLSDIRGLIQQVPAAERAHEPQLQHQQWVPGARAVSVTCG